MIQAQNNEKTAGAGEEEWLTGIDGSKHFMRFFAAADTRAYILYLHGIEGHSLWFTETASYLKGRGLSTLAFDRRGSGMCKANGTADFSGDDLLADLEQMLEHLHKKADGLPVFLMANCWGAKLAVLHCRRKKESEKRLSGLILSSPAIEVKVDLPLMKKLDILLSFILGGKKEFALPLSVEDFTDTPEYLDFIARDPKRLTHASANFLVSSFILTLLARQAPHELTLPILVLQSGQDNIVNVQGIKNWFEKLGTRDKTLRVFDSVKHSLDFHCQAQEYREMLANWILAHCREQKSP